MSEADALRSVNRTLQAAEAALQENARHAEERYTADLQAVRAELAAQTTRATEAEAHATAVGEELNTAKARIEAVEGELSSVNAELAEAKTNTKLSQEAEERITKREEEFAAAVRGVLFSSTLCFIIALLLGHCCICVRSFVYFLIISLLYFITA